MSKSLIALEWCLCHVLWNIFQKCTFTAERSDDSPLIVVSMFLVHACKQKKLKQLIWLWLWVLFLVFFWKTVCNFITTCTGIFEFRVNSCTRGGELKIFKPHSNNNFRACSFACRHVNCWNKLPKTTRNAESLSSFKRLVAKFDFINF